VETDGDLRAAVNNSPPRLPPNRPFFQGARADRHFTRVAGWTAPGPPVLPRNIRNRWLFGRLGVRPASYQASVPAQLTGQSAGLDSFQTNRGGDRPFSQGARTRGDGSSGYGERALLDPSSFLPGNGAMRIKSHRDPCAPRTDRLFSQRTKVSARLGPRATRSLPIPCRHDTLSPTRYGSVACHCASCPAIFSSDGGYARTGGWSPGRPTPRGRSVPLVIEPRNPPGTVL
jgi:hypothetical protein